MFENSSSPTMLLDGNVLLMILLLTISYQKPMCPFGSYGASIPTQNALALLNYISSYQAISSHFPSLLTLSLQFTSNLSNSFPNVAITQKLDKYNSLLNTIVRNHGQLNPPSPHCWSMKNSALAHNFLFTSMIPNATLPYQKKFTNPIAPKFNQIIIFHHPQ